LAQNIATAIVPAPLYLGQGVDDEVVSIDIQRTTDARVCAAGKPVETHEYPGRDHMGVIAQGSPLIDDLFVWADRVTAGEAIVTLSSPELDTSVERLAQRRHGLMAGLYQSLIDDPYKSRQYQEDIVALDEQAALLAEQRRLLALRAHVDGRVAIARPQDGPGRFVERGTEVGVIYPDAPMIVRVAVEQEDAARLADAGGHASVRLAGRSGTPIAARIVHIDPAAGDRLPSNALSAAHGGDVVTDPSDRDGLRPVRPIRLVDVELPIRGDGAAGSRAWVRFDFGWRSLGAQMLRHARQQFLVHFSPVES